MNIVYIKEEALTDNVAVDLTNATWNVNKAIIHLIIVVTSAVDWTLTLYSDSDTSSGMYASEVVADHKSGDQTIMTKIPYIDNDNNKAVHVKFVDNVGANGATFSIYGIEAN